MNYELYNNDLTFQLINNKTPLPPSLTSSTYQSKVSDFANGTIQQSCRSIII